MRKGRERFFLPKFLLHPIQKDVLHSKCISGEVTDQNDKLWAILKEQLPRRAPNSEYLHSLNSKTSARGKKTIWTHMEKENIIFYQIYSSLQ